MSLKFKIFPLLFLLGFLGSYQPDRACAGVLEERADQIQRAYEQTQDLQMDFVQHTYVEVLEREVKKSGHAAFKKPGKFAIHYGGPRGRQYVSDGKKLWVFQSGDSQVQVYQVGDSQVPAEALSFLAGLGHLRRDFAVETVDEKKWRGFKREKGDLHWLELTPLQKRSQIQWLVMGFDRRSFLAREVYIFTESGNLSHYTFSDLRTNGGLQEEQFKFSQKGVKEVKIKP